LDWDKVRAVLRFISSWIVSWIVSGIMMAIGREIIGEAIALESVKPNTIAVKVVLF
jgi:ABC-type phosphate transport system permease subunit